LVGDNLQKPAVSLSEPGASPLVYHFQHTQEFFPPLDGCSQDTAGGKP
jgi:hypothetical protein